MKEFKSVTTCSKCGHDNWSLTYQASQIEVRSFVHNQNERAERIRWHCKTCGYTQFTKTKG